MGEKIIKDMGASVRNRLLELSRRESRHLDSLLLQYCQERLLYRLSISRYRKNLILKGGMLSLAFDMPSKRPTRDIDLLGMRLADDGQRIGQVFREIATLECNDGVVFQTEQLTVKKIKEDAEYGGQRVTVPVRLAGARINLQIDVGFGDAIVNGPTSRKFPVLLDHPAPELMVYSAESSIAEKFEAMVRLGLTNSRMKDFYDIHFMAASTSFTRSGLKQAIDTTFQRRAIPLSDSAAVLSEDFWHDDANATKWQAFVRRTGLKMDQPFSEVMQRIADFIGPMLEGSGGETWNPAKWRWE
jgi:predicted nucleotidyltransferase component of viral defense system